MKKATGMGRYKMGILCILFLLSLFYCAYWLFVIDPKRAEKDGYEDGLIRYKRWANEAMKDGRVKDFLHCALRSTEFGGCPSLAKGRRKAIIELVRGYKQENFDNEVQKAHIRLNPWQG